MFKGILVATVIIMCFGVIANAAPLPLVPGATEATKATEEKPVISETTSTEKKTENKEKNKGEEKPVTENKTKPTGSTANKPKEEKEEQEKEKEPAPVAAESKDISALVEKGHGAWFKAQSRVEAKADKLAEYIAKEQDFRAKAKKAREYISGIRNEQQSSTPAQEDYRVAMDALHLWDYTYSGF